MRFFGRKKEPIPVDEQPTASRRRLVPFILKTLGYVAFFTALFFVSFWKRNTLEPSLRLNQPSGIRFVAPIDFEYISEIKTQERKEQQRRHAVPVYKIDLTPFRNFSQKIEQLKDELAECERTEGEQRNKKTATLIETFEADRNLPLERGDVERLLRFKKLQRNRLLDESLFILQEIAQKGIWDDEPMYETFYLQAFEPTYSDPQQRRLNVGDALRLLRTRILATVPEYDVANALIHVMRYGLTPNFIYDRQQTQEKIQKILEQTPNVTVQIAAGDVIVEFGQIVTAEIFERWQAYWYAVEHQATYKKAQNLLWMKDGFIFTLLASLTTLLLFLLQTRLRSSVRLQSATAILMLFQMLLLRSAAWFCNGSEIGRSFGLSALTHFFVPTFLSSILITALVDMPAGLIVTLMIVGLKTLLLHGSFEMFLCDLTVGWYLTALCQYIRFKKDILQAVSCGLLLYIVLISLHGFLYQPIELLTGLQRAAAAFANGLFTFLFVFFFTSPLERLFHNSTNITFLRLTDYNHPLLRKLQEVAPGTYHHSLMVAALAEKAASEIGANSLLCRCSALYHDVGKMANPSFFTENQQGDNPHNNQPPSVSVMILKNHIKEGLRLAKRYHLPRIIRELLQQHHGTFPMQYFYKKALLLKAEDETVDEAAFRYEGPKPQTREAAVLFLSDAVEASSRSLENPTEEAIGALVKSIIREREEDGQLNDSSLTINDLARIQTAFCNSLITMMHRRISYNKIDIGNASSAQQTSASSK